MNETESKIKKAIELHIKDNGMVTGPEKLAKRILAALGQEDEFEHAGWRVVRKLGKDLGCKRAAANFYGFEATHAYSGTVEKLVPSNVADVPTDYAKHMLEKYGEMIMKWGSLKGPKP